MKILSKQIWLVEDTKEYADTLMYVINNTSGLICDHHFFAWEELDAFIASPLCTSVPDLLLMDIRLPGKGGIEAVEAFRSRLPGIPVVMMTMDENRVLDSIRAGAAGYILKGEPFDRVIETIRAAMEGRLIMSEIVGNQILEHLSRKKPPPSSEYNLTNRQLDVLSLMCDGLMRAEIAERLSITYATVDNHFRHIYEKLGVRSAQAAVAIALKENLISASNIERRD